MTFLVSCSGVRARVVSPALFFPRVKKDQESDGIAEVKESGPRAASSGQESLFYAAFSAREDQESSSFTPLLRTFATFCTLLGVLPGFLTTFAALPPRNPE